jgi:hypothetical protein
MSAGKQAVCEKVETQDSTQTEVVVEGEEGGNSRVLLVHLFEECVKESEWREWE